MSVRWIIVPLNKSAEAQLDLDQAKPGSIREYRLDETSFTCLWRSGIFDMINAETGSNIDNFEDDAITDPKQLRVGRALVDSMAKHCKDEACGTLLVVLTGLFDLALARKTGVFFYF